MKKNNHFFNENKGILLILLAYLVYAFVFIWQYSFVIGGERFFVLFDDAMISMRYAKHLAAGYGLTWNIGETPVEGYSNFLWVLILSLIHFIKLSPSKMSLLVQLLAMIISMVNIFFVYKTALLLEKSSKRVALGASVLTAFYLPFNFWSLMGMEVCLVALIVTFTAWLTLKKLKNNEFSIFQLILPASAYLIRMDAALIFGVFCLFFLIVYKEKRKFIFVSGFLIFLSIFVSLTLFRYFYYGDFLPNTYYLKMTGYPLLLRLGRGFYVSFRLMFLVFPVIVFALEYIWRNRSREILLLSALFFVQVFYSFWVGGDSWEWWGGANRFLSISIPVFFILIALSLEKPRQFLTERYEILSKHVSFVYFSIILLSLIITNSNKGLPSLKESFLIEANFAKAENRKCIEIAKALESHVKDDSRLMINTAGVIPYFMNCRFIDMLGKNDTYISRINMRVSEGFKKYYDFNPGHLKWDYSYSIGKLKPDIIVHLWKNPEEAAPYLEKDYEKFKAEGFEFWKIKK